VGSTDVMFTDGSLLTFLSTHRQRFALEISVHLDLRERKYKYNTENYTVSLILCTLH
jgi:hypothetical protein